MSDSDDVPPFEIVSISSEQSEALEPLGTKPKFWFTHRDRRTLFKAENRGTGEDWAEVVACEISNRLGLPHVQYQLAHDRRNNLPGVICPNVAAKPLTLLPGNQLMVEADPSYPADGARKYGVRQHTVEAAANVVASLDPPPAAGTWTPSPDCQSAVDVFVGYVLLDTLIANQDRHHENWGALRGGSSSSLAPTFDHGAGLARNEPEAKRRRRLESPNPHAEMSVFAKRARSGFYRSQADKKTLLSLDCFRDWGVQSPQAAKHWLNRLGKISERDFQGILDRVPGSRMTPLVKEFTLQLLLINQQRLLQEGNPVP